MSNVTNVMIAGVGGQGTVLASKILSLTMMKAGHNVKQSEIHGMSQRGGSVITHVRFGKNVHSPLVAGGAADYIVSFEELEALRCLPYLKENGRVIVNKQRLLPMPVITGALSYPEEPVDEMEAMGVDVIAVDASGIGLELGDSRVANLALLGVLSRFLDCREETWFEAIGECVRPQFLEINHKAFRAGVEFAKEHTKA